MVMFLQVIAAASSDEVEVVMSSWPTLARGDAGAVELVVGIVHLIYTEYGFQTTLVKGFVVGYQWQSLYKGLYLLPYFGEDWGMLCIFCTKAMHPTAPVIVILWLWLDKGVELIYNLAVTYYNDSNRADRRAFVVGGLEIYCCKIAV